MTLPETIRVTEIMLGFAFALQSLEYLRGKGLEVEMAALRLILSLALMLGSDSQWILGGLFLVALWQLYRYQGPYNGGSDRMGLLLLCCLLLYYLAPTRFWQEMAISYLALQLVLSYFISGWVKVVNPEWRSGLALVDVFRFSAYPVSESLRRWAESPRLLLVMAWLVILFELLFPFALLSSISLYIALLFAACFHFANACLFGLNRFFWIWLAVYPSLLWFQQRIMATL